MPSKLWIIFTRLVNSLGYIFLLIVFISEKVDIKQLVLVATITILTEIKLSTYEKAT